MSGKTLRLRRFIGPSDGRTVILPLDHGVSCGPVAGLERMAGVIRMGIKGGADGLVLHKGMMACLDPLRERHPGIFMHLSAGTRMGPDPHRKVLAGSVEEALRRGADGVSVHVNFGCACESEMIADLGAVGNACAAWQVPLLVMVYACGADAASSAPDASIAHAARVAAEMGADIIKIPAPEDDEVLADIASSVPVPVVVAGGSKARDDRLFLMKIEKALQAGIRGVAIGRNVFQHEKPQAFLNAICRMVHRGCSSREAWQRLERGGVLPARLPAVSV